MDFNKYKFPFQNSGYCICCNNHTTFLANSVWYRDHYICTNCGCIPRERAIMSVIENCFPKWRELTILESSPTDRGASKRLKRECLNYIASHYFPNHSKEKIVSGFRNENLEQLSFKNKSLDLIITQDVMEYVFNPKKVFQEISRTLKPGGAHIFTVPIVNKHKSSEQWAKLKKNKVIFLKASEYHGNPIDPSGSPVTYHWGYDIVDFIYKSCGLITSIFVLDDIDFGIRAEYIDVLISRKIM